MKKNFDDGVLTLSRRQLIGAGVLAAGAVAFSTAKAAARSSASPIDIVPEPGQVGATEGLVDVGGAKLWFWDTGGDGQPVVFLHPATGSGASWVYQQPVFAKAGYRVIGYSRRGHYKSETDNNAPSPTPARTAAGPMTSYDLDDLRKLAEHLKLGRFHLVGIAAGGFIAAQYAVNFPETLRSVMLGCSLLNIQEPEYQALTGRVIPQSFSSMPVEFRELSPVYRTLNPKGTERWLEIQKNSRSIPLGNMPAGEAPAGERRPPPAGGGFGGAGVPTDPNRKPVTFATLSAMAEKVPTLLMTGDADLYQNPGVLHFVSQHVPAAAKTVINYSGHAPFWEQPAEFNRIVLDFVKRNRR